MRRRPLQRRRAAFRPSRGVERTRKSVTRFGTSSGCLFISPNIPAGEHELVLAAYEAHVAGGFGVLDRSTGLWRSSFETPRGTIILSTGKAERETYAYYAWED